MSEMAAEVELKRSPLHELLVNAGAQLTSVDGWLMPESFSSREKEYEAVREGTAGVFDLSNRGRIRVGGSEAVAFLNGLITNDMKTLAENHWMPAVFPNVQGRLLASVRVMRLVDQAGEKGVTPTFLLDTEAATHDRVLQTISRFTLAGDFKVDDISTSTACLSVQGKQAANVISQAFSFAANLSGNELRQHHWSNAELLLVHASHTGEDGYDIIVDVSAATQVWQQLLSHGAQPVGTKAFEVLRIEAGLPKFGVDVDENLVVSEANLDEAVSFTKGCYIGQEIIARIKYRGHIAKKITGLVLGGETETGRKVFSADEKEVGSITSVTFSPRLQEWIAIALIKYQYLEAGTEVTIDNSERVRGVVTELPFVKGTWYSRQADA